MRWMSMNGGYVLRSREARRDLPNGQDTAATRRPHTQPPPNGSALLSRDLSSMWAGGQTRAAGGQTG